MRLWAPLILLSLMPQARATDPKFAGQILCASDEGIIQMDADEFTNSMDTWNPTGARVESLNDPDYAENLLVIQLLNSTFSEGRRIGFSFFPNRKFGNSKESFEGLQLESRKQDFAGGYSYAANDRRGKSSSIRLSDTGASSGRHLSVQIGQGWVQEFSVGKCFAVREKLPTSLLKALSGSSSSQWRCASAEVLSGDRTKEAMKCIQLQRNCTGAFRASDEFHFGLDEAIRGDELLGCAKVISDWEASHPVSSQGPAARPGADGTPMGAGSGK